MSIISLLFSQEKNKKINKNIYKERDKIFDTMAPMFFGLVLSSIIIIIYGRFKRKGNG